MTDTTDDIVAYHNAQSVELFGEPMGDLQERTLRQYLRANTAREKHEFECGAPFPGDA